MTSQFTQTKKWLEFLLCLGVAVIANHFVVDAFVLFQIISVIVDPFLSFLSFFLGCSHW